MLKNTEFQLVVRATEPCDCGSGKRRGHCCYKCNSEGVKWRYLILPFLTLLTKVCNHVGLLLPQSRASEKQKHKCREICEEVFLQHHEFIYITRQASFQTLSDPEYCGKMKVLDKLLEVFKEEGSKVVLFSQSTQLLDFITDFVISRGYEYCRMDGSTPVKQRPALVHSFNKDKNKFLFLVSKGTGGVGLNLTGANVVIIYDPCWNPQMDMQAQDRCYRLGQSQNVKVYRFICQGTVEENIYLREVYKQQLSIMTLEREPAQRHFTCVAGDKERKGEIFGHENMFKLRVGNCCLTADILKRTSEVCKGVQMAQDELAHW
jgi:SNF2 family DNA or RNA helicase